MFPSKKCRICGVEFVPQFYNQVCCSQECKRQNHLDLVLKRQKRIRTEQCDDAQRNPPADGQWCRGCRYSMKVLEYWACDYMGQTEHRRPCPSPMVVGRRCDVYQPEKKRRKKRKNDRDE